MKNKKDISINFKKSRSLISKIAEMIENKEDIPRIMQQNLAVMGLLKSAHQMLLEKHLHDCFSHSGSSMEKKNEILKVIRTR
jgi:DNA-binding FrmR family transcriptional regulator